MGTGAQVVALYTLTLWVPGLVLGGLAGLRGWTLAAGAPLLTYAVAGLFGPMFAAMDIAWSPTSAGLLLVVLCAVAVLARFAVQHRFGTRGFGGRWFGTRWFGTRWSDARWSDARERTGPPVWDLWTHAGVAAVLGGIVVLGGTVIWAGLGQLSAIPQDWDAAFHANGIRWIADTGDSSLVGMAKVNWFEDDFEVFYPNAYHLLAAVVDRKSVV